MGEDSRVNLEKWQEENRLSDLEILSPKYLERIKSKSELVQCACGCGGWRPRYDKKGRALHYLHDHRPPRPPPRNEEEIYRSQRARRHPKIVRVMESLESEPLNTEELSKKAGVSWATALKYLGLIEWIQTCPKIRSGSGGKRILTYRREGGR